MTARATVSADGETITIHIPMTFRKRGGRKMVVTPDGAAWAPRPRVDNALVKALARAFRWQQVFESGRYANLTELAAAEKVTLPYLTSILQFAHLAPDLVEMLLDGRQPTGLTLRAIRTDLSIEWAVQRTSWPGSLAAWGKSERK
jgi:hypothetical protein